MKWLLPLILTVGMLGCAKQVTAPIPGSANQFDSSTYLSLVTVDNVIVSTRASLAGGEFSAVIAPTVKTALNNLIKAYDVANTSYRAYHNAAIAAGATQDQEAAVNAAMANVQSANAALVSVKGSH